MSLVRQFLAQVRQHVRDERDDLLRSWLQVEPNAPRQYHDMAAELRRSFAGAQAVEAVIEECLPLDGDDGDEASVWPSFQSFMRDYLTLWRDIDHDDLLQAHELLTTLVKSASLSLCLVSPEDARADGPAPAPAAPPSPTPSAAPCSSSSACRCASRSPASPCASTAGPT